MTDTGRVLFLSTRLVLSSSLQTTATLGEPMCIRVLRLVTERATGRRRRRTPEERLGKGHMRYSMGLSRSSRKTVGQRHPWSKLVALATAAATTLGLAATGASVAVAQEPTRDSYSATVGDSGFESARARYGLAKDMRDGATLHAWMWSFNTIRQNMARIAKAGYTSIQTEPIAKCKQVASNGKRFTENWYYVY